MAKKKTDEISLLRKVGILADLGEEDLRKILAISQRVAFKAGETIMREGEQGESMYFFVAGEVDVTKNLTLKLGDRDFATAEKSMNKLSANHVSVFGEMSVFGPEPRSATITAGSDCVLYSVNGAEFTELCDSEPRIGLSIVRRIAAVLCERVRKGNGDVLKLSTALSIALSR
ncbi:MAG: cyclic nucleotide-binding domain-containing protein [Rectinemataceae bacterium]|jgi:CRP-like cAMP-binding protein